MAKVFTVTGSVKSPPGGDTAPTIVTDPSLSGLPQHLTILYQVLVITYVFHIKIYLVKLLLRTREPFYNN